ncbi:MAG: enoyl-CoA hydratase/isomerase family protein [Myxococcales bacterium]|nr:enoyl-CoA hydratase/isomerase family protein [Myxococcales bacterium]MCB9643875.1 enoyl-CoA hydratase/isomerase family protein [Myxococcales bacterium]
MAEALVTITKDEQGVAILQMQDSVKKNALGTAFVEALTHALEEVSSDPEVRVCVLRGLEDVFCAGGDQDLLVALAEGEVVASDIMLSRAVLEVPVPTIAVMEGHAVGGGLTMGICCDIVMMARESRYGCSFMNMGFTPGMGTTRLLALAVGDYIAAEMMLGGQFFRGSHFEGRSQINYILPREKMWRKATQIASAIAEKPRFALEMLKRDLSLKKRRLFEEARTSEVPMHQVCFTQPETARRIRENYVSNKKES